MCVRVRGGARVRESARVRECGGVGEWEKVYVKARDERSNKHGNFVSHNLRLILSRSHSLSQSLCQSVSFLPGKPVRITEVQSVIFRQS